MRGKKMKLLRRAAEQRTIGKPAVEYERLATGAIRLKLNSTKGMYKNFKKWFKKGAIKI